MKGVCNIMFSHIFESVFGTMVFLLLSGIALWALIAIGETRETVQRIKRRLDEQDDKGDPR